MPLSCIIIVSLHFHADFFRYFYQPQLAGVAVQASRRVVNDFWLSKVSTTLSDLLEIFINDRSSR